MEAQICSEKGKKEQEPPACGTKVRPCPLCTLDRTWKQTKGSSELLGPKSQDTNKIKPSIGSSMGWIRKLALCAFGARARVGVHPVRAPGAEHHPEQRMQTRGLSAKHSMEWDSVTRNFGSRPRQTQASHNTVVAKRSFRRACVCAVEQGVTQYRGQRLRVEQLSQQQVSAVQRLLQSRVRKAPARGQDLKKPSSRISMMVWNWGPGHGP